MKRAGVAFVICTCLVGKPALAGEAPFKVTGVKATPLAQVAFPSEEPLNESVDKPDIWTLTSPPAGKQYVDLQVELAADWPDSSAMILLDHKDFLFDQAADITLLGNFWQYAAVQRVNLQHPEMYHILIYKGVNLREAQSKVFVELLVEAPASAKTVKVTVKGTPLEAPIAGKPVALDVKSRFTFKIVSSRLVKEVPSRDKTPLTNPDGKILIVNTKFTMPQSNTASHAEGPMSIVFPHNWLNVRVGKEVFGCGGDVNFQSQVPKMYYISRSSAGKNGAVTSGTNSPQHESEQAFLFFVPSSTKKYDLLFLGQSVDSGVAAAK